MKWKGGNQKKKKKTKQNEIKQVNKQKELISARVKLILHDRISNSLWLSSSKIPFQKLKPFDSDYRLNL